MNKHTIENNPIWVDSIKKSTWHEFEFFQSLSTLPKRSPYNTIKNLISNLKTNWNLYNRGTYNFLDMLKIDYMAIKDYIIPTRFDANLEVCRWLWNTDGTCKVDVTLLNDEYERYENMLIRGKKLISNKWSDIKELTGNDISWLHQTHGIEPSIVEDLFESTLSEQQMVDYRNCYNQHKLTGEQGFKKQIIKNVLT